MNQTTKKDHKDAIFSALMVVFFAATVAMIFAFSVNGNAAHDGRVDTFADGLRVASDGTKLEYIAVASLDFNASTSTVAVPGLLPGDSLYFGSAWTVTSADPGKTWFTVTTNTLRVTTTNSTSGTLKVILMGTN